MFSTDISALNAAAAETSTYSDVRLPQIGGSQVALVSNEHAFVFLLFRVCDMVSPVLSCVVSF